MNTVTVKLGNISEPLPIITTACFENGRIDEEAASKHLSFKSYVHAVKKKRKQLVAESGRLTYVGQNYGLLAENVSSACKYYIGALNKKTGKMRIHDTEIFHMKPKLKSDEPENIFEDHQVDLSFRERSNLLTSDFGSSKKRRAMESRLKFQVSSNELDDAMKHATDEIFQNETIVNQLSASVTNSEESTIPPCYKEASSVEDVYQLHDIISNLEMEEITNDAKIFYNSEREQVSQWIEEEAFPKYVSSHLKSLPVQEDQRWLKCKQLMYLNYMFKFARMPAKAFHNKKPLPVGWPDAVQDKLLAMFTLKAENRNKIIRCIPKRLKDKLLSYILVLTLIIDGYSVTIEDLMEDSKLGPKSLTDRFRLLGCRVKLEKPAEGKKTHVATLKLPLDFPKDKNVKLKRQ